MKIIYYFLNYVSFLPHQLQYVHLQNKSNTQEYKYRVSNSIKKPHNSTYQVERRSLGLELSENKYTVETVVLASLNICGILKYI